jgi:hypothetical protein
MFLRHLLLASRILQNEAGADGGAGGGGGASVFNDAQLTAIKALVSGVVNQTISARDKMSDKKRGEDAKAAEDRFAKMLDEKLSSFKPSGEEPPDGGGKPGKKGDNVAFDTLKRQFEEQKTLFQAAEKRAKDAIERNRSVTLRQTTAEQLGAFGIDGARFKGAFAVLQQEGRIRHRDDESEDMVFVDDMGSEVELAVGLASWAKSDDAKIYLPPSGTRGSGSSKPANGGPPAGGKPNQNQQFEMIGNALKERLSEL